MINIEKANIDFFSQYLKEADDIPPDVAAQGVDNTPDVPDDVGDINAGPPDIPDDVGGVDNVEGEGLDDAPPDLDEGFGDEPIDDEATEEQSNEDTTDKDLGIDEKVSAIMNQKLYRQYLNLLTEISNQILMIKTNNDLIYSISANALDIVSSLKRLDENIRLYIKNNFVNENYSKNLLFFNKCLNLLKLLNDSFDSNIKKGIKEL